MVKDIVQMDLLLFLKIFQKSGIKMVSYIVPMDQQLNIQIKRKSGTWMANYIELMDQRQNIFGAAADSTVRLTSTV